MTGIAKKTGRVLGGRGSKTHALRNDPDDNVAVCANSKSVPLRDRGPGEVTCEVCLRPGARKRWAR